MGYTPEFNVGPPDDAENVAVMRLGINTRKKAMENFKSINSIVKKHDPECSAKEAIGYQWQGMISLAAYSVAITQLMLLDTGWKWDKDQPPTIGLLSDQVEDLAQKFFDSVHRKDND